MILILITATASVAVYLAICLRFIGTIVGDNGLLKHILFISEGKEIILRLEGTDALHQEAVTKEDGFITIIVGSSLLAYFLSVLCPCLVNG